jgi:hypothetical protein
VWRETKGRSITDRQHLEIGSNGDKTRDAKGSTKSLESKQLNLIAVERDLSKGVKVETGFNKALASEEHVG